MICTTYGGNFRSKNTGIRWFWKIGEIILLATKTTGEGEKLCARVDDRGIVEYSGIVELATSRYLAINHASWVEQVLLPEFSLVFSHLMEYAQFHRGFSNVTCTSSSMSKKERELVHWR